MIKKLIPVLTGALPPGLYRFASRAQPANIGRQVEAAGWRAFYLEGAQMVDKATFLHASAAAMQFPAYFGANWDAFEESINDLAWAPAAGYVILFDDVARFVGQAPEQWDMAYAILRDAVARWQQSGTAMYVLLRNTGPWMRELPQI